MVTTDSDEEKRREITGVYPQSLQDPRMGGSRLAKMADEEEELGTLADTRSSTTQIAKM